LLRADGFARETTEKLANWNPYDQNASADFFDPEWMFGIREGFDVLIGNPPYVSALVFTELYGEALRNALNASFASATGAYDVFVLFLERGIRLLRQSGVLSFITPNKYLAAKYAAGIRTYILENSSLQRLVDVSGVNVFESASVYPVITILTKTRVAPSRLRVLLPLCRMSEAFELGNYRECVVPYEMLKLLPENIWGFVLSRSALLLPKLINSAEPLAKLGEVNATSTAAESDEYGAFLINKPQAGALKVLNTGTIDPYASFWGQTELTHQGKTFLTPYLPLAKAAVNERRQEMYRSPKVLFAKMAKTCEAFIDENGEYASLNTNCFYRPRKNISLKYVGGFVNSRLFMFLYDLFFGALRMAGGYYQFQAPQLRVIPVKIPTADQQREISKLVERILAAKRANPQADTSAWEREIDERVYRLYGLTAAEIKIVEENTK
jgi:adenine-specific DNA-methyltransferase